jgi:hypothetical protein
VSFALLAGILWALVSDLTPSQRISLGAVLGVALAVGATTDLIQALEFYAVLALAQSFVSHCVGSESEDAMREFPLHEFLG